MTQIEFAPVEIVSWSCMLCGYDKPEDVSREVFHGWTCDNCGHIICGRCLDDIKKVNTLPECNWWSCESTKVAKVAKLREALVKPKLTYTPDFEFESAPILMANKTHVHWLGDNGDWSELPGVLGVNIEMNNNVDYVHAGLGTSPRMIVGAQQRTAEMIVHLDEENMDLFKEGGIYVVSMETSEGMKTRFRGMLTSSRESILAGEPVTMDVQLVEVESADYPLKDSDNEPNKAIDKLYDSYIDRMDDHGT